MEPWMTDDLVKDIPKEKLQILSELMKKRRGNDPKEMMRQLLPLIKECKQKGIQFTSSEVTSAIAAIRKHSSSEENAQIDEILRRTGYHGNP